MLRLATLILATTRLTTLITQDEISAPLREKVDRAATQDPHSRAATLRLPYLLSCNRCTSVWAAAATLLLYAHPRTRPIPQLLALSQAAITTFTLLDLLDTHPAHPTSLDLDLTLPDAPGEEDDDDA